MYLFQSETETHFQCPECGQRGAVLTKDFDQAVKTSPYVRITCTSCQSKFEPNHRASPEAFASSIATTINVPELAAAFEEVATPAPDDLPIIDDEFGALPAWLRPDYKDDSTASCQTEAAANAEKTPDSQALEAIAAFIKADMGDPVVSPPPATAAPSQKPKGKADNKAQNKTKATEEGKTEPASASDSVSDSVSTPAPVIKDAVPVVAVDRVSFGRRFLSLSWKLFLLAALVAAGFMTYLQIDRPRQKQAAPTAPAIAQSNIRIGEVRHEIITDNYGSAAKVYVQFANTGLRKGAIESFYIVLLDAQDQTLASWRVTGRGHSLDPNQMHEVSSTLFNPPKNIARVSIRYPAR